MAFAFSVLYIRYIMHSIEIPRNLMQVSFASTQYTFPKKLFFILIKQIFKSLVLICVVLLRYGLLQGQ